MPAVDQLIARPKPAPPKTSHRLRSAIIGFLLVLLGFGGWTAFKLWRSWTSLDRVDFNVEAALQSLESRNDPVETSPGAPSLGDELFNSFLIVGNDNRPGFEGNRADVIILILFPKGHPPAIVSIPRDLYLDNPCTGAPGRINATFNGCGDDASGPELLAITVQRYTGVKVDHFALFDFEGFKKVIDAVGGVTICVENPVRDFDAELDLPAGCTRATGAQALGWVRTRKTQELVNGSWRAMPGQSDLTRNQHQQDMIFQLFQRMKSFSSLGELTAKVAALSDAFVVDQALSIPSALRLAWKMRAFDPEDFVRLQIPVKEHVTSAGAEVLLPTANFSDILKAALPDLETSGRAAG